MRAGWGFFVRRGPFRFWIRWDLTRWIVFFVLWTLFFVGLQSAVEWISGFQKY